MANCLPVNEVRCGILLEHKDSALDTTSKVAESVQQRATDNESFSTSLHFDETGFINHSQLFDGSHPFYDLTFLPGEVC